MKLVQSKYGYAEDAQRNYTKSLQQKAYQELIKTAQVEIMFEGWEIQMQQKRFSAKSLLRLQEIQFRLLGVQLTRPQQGEVEAGSRKMDVKTGKNWLWASRVENMDSYTKMNAERVAIGLFGGTASSFPVHECPREKMEFEALLLLLSSTTDILESWWYTVV